MRATGHGVEAPITNLRSLKMLRKGLRRRAALGDQALCRPRKEEIVLKEFDLFQMEAVPGPLVL